MRSHTLKKSIPWLALALLVAAGATTVALTSTPDLGRALAAQRILVEENPYDASAFNDLGNLLTLADDEAGAEEAYRRAVELAPEAISPRYNLGLLLQNDRRYREALAEFQVVLDNAPDHAWALYQVGAVYEVQGQTARAIRWYGHAFALDPRLAFAEYNPSVIENDLVDEAMLRGYRHEGARPLAPRVYEEPSRIQALMLPEPPESPGESGSDEAAAMEQPEPPMGGAAEPPQPGSASGPDTLDPDDLDSRQVNQATSGGSSQRFRSKSRARSQGRSWQRPRAAPQPSTTPDRTPTPQGGRVVAPGAVDRPSEAQPPSSDPTAPGSRVRTPRGRTGFTPGVSSTSRMELQLLGADGERLG